jgi:hypothetical protein
MRSGFSPESLARLPMKRYALHASGVVFLSGAEKMPEAARGVGSRRSRTKAELRIGSEHRRMLTWLLGNTFVPVSLVSDDPRVWGGR